MQVLGAKCNQFKLEVHAHLNASVGCACVRATQKRDATHTLKNMSEDIDVDLFSYERSFV